MSISLQKGQKIDLTKGNAGLSKLVIGLGWDPVETKKKGLFGSLISGNSVDIDCDASVIMLDSNGKFPDKRHIVYFGNLKSFDDSIVHMGDSLTGEGDGDDEQIKVDLSKVSPSIHRLVFVVNIYQCVKRKQDFGMIQNAFIRVVNDSNNQELIKYNLSNDYKEKTTLITGEIYRHDGEWKFAAIGEGTNDTGLNEIITRYR